MITSPYYVMHNRVLKLYKYMTHIFLYRVLEVLSRHKSLYRVTVDTEKLKVITMFVSSQFFPCIIHSFVMSSQKGLLQDEVKVYSPIE